MAHYKTVFEGQRQQAGRSDWEFVADSVSRAGLEADAWWLRAQTLCPDAAYRIIERAAISHDDGDVVRAVLQITQCDADGIDHVVAERPIRGVVSISASGLVSLNHPDDSRRPPGEPYVAMRRTTVNGCNSVLTNLRVEDR